MYKREFLMQQLDLLNWPLLSLAIFFGTFCIVLVYVLIVARRRQEALADLAAMPLEDDERPGGVS